MDLTGLAVSAAQAQTVKNLWDALDVFDKRVRLGEGLMQAGSLCGSPSPVHCCIICLTSQHFSGFMTSTPGSNLVPTIITTVMPVHNLSYFTLHYGVHYLCIGSTRRDGVETSMLPM